MMRVELRNEFRNQIIWNKFKINGNETKQTVWGGRKFNVKAVRVFEVDGGENEGESAGALVIECCAIANKLNKH
jgi:hypothetical protein